VLVEPGAGTHAAMPDADFVTAGASMACAADI
jgi:NAD/NADP transhydrogenase alpha subunit